MLVAATTENLSLFEAEISQLILAAVDDEFDELDGPADEQLAGVSLVRQVSSKSNALSKLQTAQVPLHYCQLTATVHCSLPLCTVHCSLSCSCHLIIHLTAHSHAHRSLLTAHCSCSTTSLALLMPPHNSPDGNPDEPVVLNVDESGAECESFRCMSQATESRKVEREVGWAIERMIKELEHTDRKDKRAKQMQVIRLLL